MLYIILGVLVFAIVMTVIVCVHEWGHFFFAKRAGVLCHEFAAGMGPVLVKKKKGETTYSIRAFPIGGFVAMAGEEVESDLLKDVKKVKLVFDEKGYVKFISTVMDNEKLKDLPEYNLIGYNLIGTKDALEDELYIDVNALEGTEVTRFVVCRNCMINMEKQKEMQIAPYDRVFNNKPLGKRFMSVFAGPMMNFVLALVIFFLMGVIYGYADTSTTRVNEVSEGALAAGIENGDTILTIGENNLSTWNDLSNATKDVAKGNGIQADGGVTVTYLSKSTNEEITTTVYPLVYIYSMEMILKYDKETPSNKVLVGDYGTQMSETKAGKAGLKPNDEIYKMGVGTTVVDINGINDILTFMTSDTCEKAVSVDIYYYRDVDGTKQENKTAVTIYSKAMLDASNLTQTACIFGVSTASKFNFVKLLYMPWVQTYESSIQIFKTLSLIGKKGSGIKLTDFSGPVGIMNLFVKLVKGPNAFYNVLYWTGLISVNVGVLNLLPIPALDGSRLLLQIVEGITKKKPNPKVENIVMNVGLIVLLAFCAVILFSDIIKCF